jgi:hypothetical protein
MAWTRWVTFACVTCVSIAVGTRTSPAQAANAISSSSADSARAASFAIRQAHRVQAAFERTRRMLLPRTQPSDDNPCDERIGRLCYWHRGNDSVGPEPTGITRARDRLIDQLVALMRVAPDDPWIVGESVHYLVEAGYDSSAILVARDCRSTPWWCSALRGFVLHDLERYADAEAAFDSALAAMPASARCTWNDLSLLLSDDERETYARTPCAQRTAYERRFWELADPSYAIPGNDRRTEHFTRLVQTTLARDAENPYGLPWGDDLRELTIRYGAPTGFTTTWSDPLHSWRPIVGHDREPSYRFSAIGTGGDDVRWDVRAERSRERYAPRYVSRIDDFPAQFGLFRRGDSALVVAMYADTGTATSRTLLGVTDESGFNTSDTGAVHVRQSTTTWKSVVVGVERYDTVTKRLERAREWLAPPTAAPGAPVLSTVLLYAPTDTNGVASLGEATQCALSSTDLGSSRRVGLYWEMYSTQRAEVGVGGDTVARDSAGSDPTHIEDENTDSPSADSTADSTSSDPDVTVAITITRTDGGVWRWLAQRLRLESKMSPLTMGWRDVPGTPGGVAKSVVLDLSQLPAGQYRIELSAGPDAIHRTVAVRNIRLR